MSGFLLPFVVAATFVLLLACDSEKQTVFPNFSSAIVYGTVFEDAGATVAHALVILEHRRMAAPAIGSSAT